MNYKKRIFLVLCILMCSTYTHQSHAMSASILQKHAKIAALGLGKQVVTHQRGLVRAGAVIIVLPLSFYMYQAIFLFPVLRSF